MNWKLFLGLSFLTLGLGCKNDIDINADYKDVAIIYGFLDQNQPVQYIRIQKLYQNSGSLSTTEGAQNPDSLYFDSLVVKLINITSKDTFLCYKVDSIKKDSGFFSSGKNTLYAASFVKKDNANEVFVLDVYYPKKDIHFTSQTSLVKDAFIEWRKIVIKLDIPNHVFVLKFTPGRNAFLYDIVCRYQYKEMNANDTNIFEIKTLDYQMAKSFPYSSGSKTLNISSQLYIDFLKSQITPNAQKIRRTYGMSFIVYGGSQEFKIMKDLNSPNLSIVQKNPLYSNIKNGIGIFTSRNYKEMEMPIDPVTFKLLAKELPNYID